MVGGWASRTCTKGDGIGDFERAPERFGLSRLERRVCYTGCCEPGHGSTGDVARARVERHDAAVATQESREPALPAAMLVERQPGRCSARAVYMPCACRAHAVRMPCACRAHAVHMPCTCRAHAVHILCTCRAHAVHMHIHMPTCSAHTLAWKTRRWARRQRRPRSRCYAP